MSRTHIRVFHNSFRIKKNAFNGLFASSYNFVLFVVRICFFKVLYNKN